jgi:hypothetical protein
VEERNQSRASRPSQVPLAPKSAARFARLRNLTVQVAATFRASNSFNKPFFGISPLPASQDGGGGCFSRRLIGEEILISCTRLAY